jgi:hypothetical protein
VMVFNNIERKENLHYLHLLIIPFVPIASRDDTLTSKLFCIACCLRPVLAAHCNTIPYPLPTSN